MFSGFSILCLGMFLLLWQSMALPVMEGNQGSLQRRGLFAAESGMDTTLELEGMAARHASGMASESAARVAVNTALANLQHHESAYEHHRGEDRKDWRPGTGMTELVRAAFLGAVGRRSEAAEQYEEVYQHGGFRRLPYLQQAYARAQRYTSCGSDCHLIRSPH